MKIVSWNCQGKFREKYLQLESLKADLYVIQECENPAKKPSKHENFFINYIWIGSNQNKGLGVFAKSTISLKKNLWKKFSLREFLSVKVNNTFNLLGIWACKPYIEEYYIYQEINYQKYDSNMIIIGDFNSNAVWDKKHGFRNHTAVVEKIESKGLVSAYHFLKKENFGSETQKTFCLYRKKDKSYHIDYAFAHKSRIKDFKILDSDEWLKYSDHRPIFLEIYD